MNYIKNILFYSRYFVKVSTTLKPKVNNLLENNKYVFVIFIFLFRVAPIWSNGERIYPLTISPECVQETVSDSLIHLSQDIVLDKRQEDLFRKLIYNLVFAYHAYAGVTMGPPRIIRYNNEIDILDENQIDRNARVTSKTVRLFKSLFMSNTRLPNIATIDLNNEHYIDYALLIHEYLPENGVIVYSNDRRLFEKINMLNFFETCDLKKDDMGYRLSYRTSIRIMNGYNNKYKEVHFKYGRVIDLKLYIFIDPEKKKAKIYRIENITKKIVPNKNKTSKTNSYEKE